MEYKELELLVDVGYDIHQARRLDFPYFGIGDILKDIISRSKLKEKKGLLFFSGKRHCYVIPDGRAHMSVAVRRENFILGISDSTYVPMIYTDGLVIYSLEDNTNSDFTRIEFPFLHTALSVAESSIGIEIYFYESEQIPFSQATFLDIESSKVREFKRKKIEGERLSERYVHFKNLNTTPVFYLPNAKVRLP